MTIKDKAGISLSGHRLGFIIQLLNLSILEYT